MCSGRRGALVHEVSVSETTFAMDNHLKAAQNIPARKGLSRSHECHNPCLVTY
jgi:hypothetical protein